MSNGLHDPHGSTTRRRRIVSTWLLAAALAVVQVALPGDAVAPAPEHRAPASDAADGPGADKEAPPHGADATDQPGRVRQAPSDPPQPQEFLFSKNESAWGIWSDGTTIWVADSARFSTDTTVALYAYDLVDGARDEDNRGRDSRDIALDADNTAPAGVWSDGATVWVADQQDGLLYAYGLSDGARTEDGDGRDARDIALDADNAQPSGIWSDTSTVWVADSQDRTLYAYDLDDGGRNEDSQGRDARDIALDADNHTPSGIWSDGRTMWVVNFDPSASENHVFAYELSSSRRVEDVDGRDAKDIALRSSNRYAVGAWANDAKTHMWIADSAANRVFVYTVPNAAPGFEEGGSATRRLPSNSAAGDLVGEPVVATDPDADILLYALSGTDAGSFEIESGTGQILVAAGATLTSSARLAVTVTATDVRGAAVSIDVTVEVTDDIRLPAGNVEPVDIWMNSSTMWVGDAADTYMHAYTRGTATVAAGFGFNLDAQNTSPVSVWSNGANIWVVDDDTDRLYAYTQAGSPVGADDIVLDAANASPVGAWSNGTDLWLVADATELDAAELKVYAYTLAGIRMASSDFVLAEANADPVDIWSDGEHVWVADREDRRLYAYTLTGTRVPSRDFRLNPDNTDAAGIWSDGDVMWVVDPTDRTLYQYDFNTPTFLDGAETTREVAENAGTDTRDEVGVPVAATHAGGLSLTYSLAGVEAALFEIDASGQITVAESTTLDYETQNVYALTVSVHDGQDSEGNADLTIDASILVQVDVTKDIIIDETTGGNVNKRPRGMWSDEETIWVTRFSNTGASLAHARESGARDSSKDVDIGARRVYMRDVWSDGINLWAASTTNFIDIVDVGETDDEAFAPNNTNNAVVFLYPLPNGPRSSDFVFFVDENREDEDLVGLPGGIWSDGTVMWIVDLYYEKILAYNICNALANQRLIAAGEDPVHQARQPDREFFLYAGDGIDDGNASPYGIWSDNRTVWVVDITDTKLYAYNLEGGTRLPHRDLDLRPGNDAPSVIWSDGTTLWVGDDEDLMVYAYTWPPGVVAEDQDLRFTDCETAERSVAENSVFPTPVGATIEDSNFGTAPYTYELAGPDRSLFTIDTDGQIRVGPRTNLNFEAAKNTYRVIVTIEDADELTRSINVNISVDDVVEPPKRPGRPNHLVRVPNRLEISWRAAPNTGPPVRYEVQYADEGTDDYATVADGLDDDLVAIIPDLSPDTTYTVRVRALNDEGISSWRYRDLTTRPAVSVIINPISLDIEEGGSGSYTVVLGSEPTGNINADRTVTVSITAEGDTDYLVVSDTSLTFERDAWNVPQTVTVSAISDTNTDNETATISHSAEGGGFRPAVIDDVSVTVQDSSAVRLSVVPDVVSEDVAGAGQEVSVTASLRAARTVPTVVSVSVGPGTADASDFAAVDGFNLEVPAGVLSASRSFLLVPIDDAVAEDDETVQVSGTVSDLAVTPAFVTIADDDERAVVPDPRSLTLVEDGPSQTFTVTLGSEPTGRVNVTVLSSSSDLEARPASLAFSVSNWFEPQTVTVTAKHDADAEPSRHVVTLLPSGGGYGTSDASVVLVSVTDDDTESTSVALSVTPADPVDENAGDTTLTVRAQLNAAARTEDTVVAVSVSDGTAAAPDDFTAVADFDVTIDAGSSFGTDTFTFTPTNDNVDEPDETVNITGTTADLSVTDTMVTIADDDTAAIDLERTADTVDEGDGFTYTVVLASEPTAPVVVTVTSDNTDVDVSTTLGTTLRFTDADWDTAQTVTVSTDHDSDAADDMAKLAHTAVGGGYDDVTAEFTVTVTDDETAAVTLTVAPDSVAEDVADPGTEVTVTAELTLIRSDPTTVTVSVSAGTASASDFAAVTGFDIVIPAGQTTELGSFTLNPADDDVAEGDETVNITGTAGDLSVTSATVTIADDDERAVVPDPRSLTLAEEGPSQTFTVTLGSQPTGPVDVSVASSSATVEVQPTSLSFTVANWSDPQTVEVTAKDDADAADDPSTAVTLIPSGGGYGATDAAAVAVSVTDDDTESTSVALTVMPDTVAENDGDTTLTVRAQLNAAARTVDTVVAVSVSPGTGTGGAAASDFAAVDDFDVTIDAGSSFGTGEFTFTPDNDDVDESDETVNITGTTTSSGLSITNTTVTIADNDTAAINLSRTAHTVDEGDMFTYTVVLASEPTAPVVVTVASDNTDVDVSTDDGATLTFTDDDWGDAQTVTVNTDHDDDAADDTAKLTHTAVGGGYDDVTAQLTVTVTDDEVAAVMLSVAPDSVAEDVADPGTRVTVTAELTAARGEPTTVTVSVRTGTADASDFDAVADFDIVIPTGQTTQSASFALNPDDDAVAEGDEVVRITATAGGLRVTPTTVTIADDDERAVVPDPQSLTLAEEGASQMFAVTLGSQPTGRVNVSVASLSAAVEVQPASLAFTASNWSDPKTVTVTAKDDTDAADLTTKVTLVPSGGGYVAADEAEVSISVTDDDTESTSVELTVTPNTVAENDGDTTLTVTAKLDEAARAEDTVVTVSVSAGTGTGAATASDFTAVADFNVTIDAGSSFGTADFTFTPDNDDVDEPDETVEVTGTTSSGLSVTDTTVTIADDDTAAISLEHTARTVDEGDMFTYTVVLATEPTGPVVVTVASDNTDVNASTTLGTTLRFTAGDWDTAQTVTVSTDQDSDAADDMAKLAHTAVGGGYDDVTAELTVTVTDDETAAVTLTVAPDLVAEDVAGTGTLVTVTAELTAARGEATTVTVSVQPGTADASDFDAVTDFAIVIPMGQTTESGSFTLNPDDDDVAEGDETIDITGTAGDLSVTAAMVTIADDDERAVVPDPQSLTFVEEGPSQTFTVTLGSQPTGPVNVSVASSSATVEVQPTSLAFTMSNWSDPQTVEVTAKDDADAADNPTEAVTLTPSGGGYVATDEAEVSISVTDNDTESTSVALTVDPDTVAENDGDTTLMVTAELDEATRAEDTIVRVSVSAGTGTGGAAASDFTAVADFNVTIDAGSFDGTGTFTFTPHDDDVDEDNETVNITGTTADLSVTDATVTITDDDNAGISLSRTAQTVDEDDMFTYTVVLDTEPTGPVTVTITSDNDDVDASTDDDTTVSFTAEDWNQAHTVTVMAEDDNDAADDNAKLTHTAVGGGYDDVTADLAVTVTDDDTASTSVELTVTPDTVDEDDGDTTVTVRAQLNAAARTEDTVVSVSVSAGTAVAGDFTAVTDFNVTIDTGSFSGTETFTFTPTNDDVDEDDETVNIAGTTADLPVTGTMVTIADDDTAGITLSPTAHTVDEGDSFTYTVKLTSEPTAPVVVTVASDNTDVDPSTADGTTLTFTDGNWDQDQTVTVDTDHDSDATNDTATLTHTASGGGYNDETAQFAVTVTDDETPAVTLTAAPDTVDEDVADPGTQITVTARLAQARSDPTTVTVSVQPGTASASDYATVADFDIVIAANATTNTGTFTLNPVNDDIAEGDETIEVTGTAGVLPVTPATVTIADDDTAGISLSRTARTVAEGDSFTYTVVLASEPTAPVVVTVASDNTDVDPSTTLGTTLRFTDADWDQDQTVTVNTDHDTDATNDTAKLTHTATGGGYNNETAELAVTVTDDETPAVTLTAAPDTVDEDVTDPGTQITVTARLAQARSDPTTVSVTVGAGTASAGDFAEVTGFDIVIAANQTSNTAAPSR